MKKQFMIDTLFVYFFLVVTLPGCSDSTETYYPLKEGRTWEYQMSAGSMLGPGGTTKVIVTNFAPRELKGKKVTPQKVDAGVRVILLLFPKMLKVFTNLRHNLLGLWSQKSRQLLITS